MVMVDVGGCGWLVSECLVVLLWWLWFRKGGIRVVYPGVEVS